MPRAENNLARIAAVGHAPRNVYDIPTVLLG